VPVDGRLNTPGYKARVSAVAWPARNNGQEPTPGRRFVRFTLEVTALAQSPSPTSPAPALGAALLWNGTSHPLSVTSIDDELQAGAGGSSDSASASYMASVPDDTHAVDLVLSEGTFSQSFDLWSLRRVPPSPAVLYRDPTRTSLTGSAAGPTTLSLANPSDGFTSSADVTLQSATLGFFAPSGTTLSPSPDQAVLSVVLDGEFPNNPNDPAGSGHYLGGKAPLPASMLSFTPNGAGAVPATISDAGDNTGKGNSDDGLFDATYSFLVPASLTSGTLAVAAGSFTGAEFTLYTAESGTTTLGVSAPATLALSFTAPVAEAAQRTPPWVGQPDPPTSAASTSALGSRSSGGSNHSPGLPIGVAIGALALAAVAAVLFERWRRSRRFAAASTTASPATALSDPAPPSSAGPLVASFAQDAEVLDPDVSSSAAPADDVLDPTTAVLGSDATRAYKPDIATGPVVAPVAARAVRPMAVDVLGWRHFVGVPDEGGSPSLEALLTYLAFHNAHHLSADQIALGMWPLGRQKGDVARKTIHNNLSALRAWIGVEHLPDAAAAGGYLLEGVGSDWSTFGRLNREADTVHAEAARALRTEALELVRGRPFEGLKGDGYGWIDEEGLLETMTKAIVTCAVRLGSDLIEAAEYAAAEDAARAGLRGAPDDYVLWELGARAIWARADHTALRRWLREAGYHLEPPDVERIRASLGHQDPPAS